MIDEMARSMGLLPPVRVVLAGLPCERAGAVRFALRALGEAADELRARALAGEAALLRQLEEAWAAWGLRGAALVEPGRRPRCRLGISPDLKALRDPEAEVLEVDYMASTRGSSGGVRGAIIGAPEPPPVVATDPLLLLNVLGRARGPVLIARAPLALEPGFLERELISRDARLLALARGEGR